MMLYSLNSLLSFDPLTQKDRIRTNINGFRKILVASGYNSFAND